MLKKGDLVVMHTCGEAEHYPGQIWTCKGDEFTSSSNSQVVFLEGFSGCFLAKYLQIVNLSELQNEVEHLKKTVNIYELVDDYVKKQSERVRHLFPLENTVGYGQLCDKVLELDSSLRKELP